MDKLVYLFELDSVRNTKYEVEKGQRALYQELVCNGNCVVLTYNQLTDSVAFLSAMQDDTSYEALREMFRLGRLRVSRFRSCRTASQFVQSSIQSCLEDNRDAFRFSSLPVRYDDKEMLRLLQRVLVNSDPSELEEYIDQREAEHADENELAQLRYVSRYVRMMLFLSTEALAGNPAKAAGQIRMDFMGFYGLIVRLGGRYGFRASDRDPLMREVQALWPLAVRELEAVRRKIEREAETDRERSRNLRKRTVWHNHLDLCPESDAVCLAEAVTDLVYNYANEESILGVSAHYTPGNEESFWADFAQRLAAYWEDYRQGNHVFHQPDDREKPVYTLRNSFHFPDWRSAQRLLEKQSKAEGPGPGTPECYEQHFEEERRRWRKKLSRSIWKNVLVMLVSIVAFVGWEELLNLAQGYVIDALNGGWLLTVLYECVGIILFGVLDALVTQRFPIHDLFDSIREIGWDIHDFRVYRRAIQGHSAYNQLETEAGA